MRIAPYRYGRQPKNRAPSTPEMDVRGSRELERLRREIEELDRALVRLVAARCRASSRAVRLRLAAGGPLTDVRQERVVLDRVRTAGVALGLSGALVDEVFRALLDAGKRQALLEGERPGTAWIAPV